jgi:phosphatidylinositol alpha-mannosyltransferase
VKIGIVTEYFYPTLGGITENIYHFALNLLRRGHKFKIITGRGKSPEGIDPRVLSKIIYVGKSVPTFFNGSCGRVSVGVGLCKKMSKIFERERFDIIHLHSPMYPTLTYIANMRANAPLVATYHTCTDNTLLYSLAHVPLRNMAQRIAGHIAVSETCAADNRRFFDLNFDIIPNGVDVKWWAEGRRSIKKFDDGKINILFLGRPDSRNGLETLISAFEIIHENFPKTRLIVVGDGPLGFYFKSLVPDSLKDSVFFEGKATDKRRDYLAMADIMCFTPDIASFGVTILEGMSAGKAIIASDIPAFRGLVTDGESALLVKPRDVGRLASAITRLLKDEELRASIAATAAMRVERYDWKRVTQLHLEYYDDILRRTGRQPKSETSMGHISGIQQQQNPRE